MSITKVSEFVLDDNSVSAYKLKATLGTNGQVLAIDSSNNLYFTNRVTSEEIDDRVAALIAGGTHTNISIIYDDVANTLSFNASGAVTSVNSQTGAVVLTTTDIAEGTNLYFTTARARSSISASGDLSYNSSTGVLSVTTYKTADFNTDFASKTTTNLTEGTNLYYTAARARSAISVTDSGGDGALSYNSTTGVITYTGPNDAEIRAHFSGGTGVGIINGQISIGQDVSTTANVTFNNIRATGNVQVDGNLTVSGTTVTINATNLAVEDNMIYLNSGSLVSNPDLGIAGNYNDGTYRHTGIFRDATDGRWKIFDQYTPEPDASVYIDTGHASFRLAEFQASTIYANLTGNVTGTVSSFSNHTTTDLTEGTNLYFTDERVDDRVSSLLVAGTNISLTYNDAANTLTVSSNNTGGYNLSNNTTTDLAEGTNLYFTTARARTSISASGDLSYNSTTGVLSVTTYKTADFNTDFASKTTTNLTEGTNLYFTNERAQDTVASMLVAGTNIGLTYNDAANTLTITANGLTGSTTDNLTEGTTNLYFTNERAQDAIGSLLVAGTNIALTYNDAANTLTIASTNSGGYNLSNNTTTDLAEGTNLYYTAARARNAISVTDNGGDGALSYNSTTGVISYTGPNDAEIRAHFSAGTGVTITSGQISIGQAVATTSNVQFADMILTGNLTVSGTTTSINTVELQVADNIITLNSDLGALASPTENAGIEVNRGNQNKTAIRWNETTDKWQFTNNGTTYQDIGSLASSTTDDLTEGTTNLYFTTERAQDAVAAALVGGTNITVAYNDSANTITVSANSTGGFDLSHNTTDNLPQGVTNKYYASSLFNADLATKTTTDLAEGTNLYYTNTRADARVNILRSDLAVSGNASVHFNNLTNVPVVIKDTLTGDGTKTNFILSASPGSPEALIVTLNGVTQTPGSDYTVSGITLTFSTALPSGQVAIVRHVGYQVVGGTTGNYLPISGGTMSGSIFVDADNTYDLGTSSVQWRAVYGHSITATYADLAERYEADEPYDIGTVVVFGGDKEITSCTTNEDVSVAGVISGNPAFKMNSLAGSDDSHPYVALRGRVPCRVFGPVYKGDLLVTSDKVGCAKSVGKNDKGHAVFAKSLTEDISGGFKTIEVVII